MLGAVQKIGEPCQSPFNAGFLTHLYLLRTEDVVYVNSPAGSSITQDLESIGILMGSPITQFLIKPKTAVFSESSAQSADGTAYQMRLSVPLKGAAPDVTTWVHRNAARRFVILTRDTLGNCYLAGSPENGARLSWSRQVGTQSSHEIALTLMGWHPAQFIPTVDLEELFQDREFDYSFDLSFS